MPNKTNQTASFMVRFSQQIFEEKGEANVQWRGRVSHVQDGEQMNFADFNEAIAFMQEKLAALTMKATQDKSPEEQDGILNKSFYIWKKMAQTGPKILMDAIKDPKKQVAQIQGQMQEISEDISSRVETEVNQWRAASKNDFKEMQASLEEMHKQIKKLNKKIDKLKK